MPCTEQIRVTSGDTILNYLLNAGVIQSGIKYGVPLIRNYFPITANPIGMTAMLKKIKKRRAVSSIRYLYRIFNLCRSSGRDFWPVGNDPNASKYSDVSVQ